MENSAAELDLKNLVKELSQGRELAKQLRAHLNAQSSSSSAFLIQRILYSYDQALSMLMHTRPAGGGEMPPPLATSDSLAGSPHSDDSDQDQASRKRNKAVAQWSDKIKVCPEAYLMTAMLGVSTARNTSSELNIPEGTTDAAIGMGKGGWLQNKFKDPMMIRPVSKETTAATNHKMKIPQTNLSLIYKQASLKI